MRTVGVLAFVWMLLVQACEDVDYSNPELAIALRSSAESIDVGDQNLILETYLWRDFMPIAAKDGSALLCVNYLKEEGEKPLLPTLELKRQYVLKGSDVWVANYSEIRKENDFFIEGVVRGGPKWGPDILVDVVCEFEYQGNMYRIIARDQLIHKTM